MVTLPPSGTISLNMTGKGTLHYVNMFMTIFSVKTNYDALLVQGFTPEAIAPVQERGMKNVKSLISVIVNGSQ